MAQHHFVSHASSDASKHAAALVAELESLGQRCWIAPRDITIGGGAYSGKIVDAIETCSHLILMLTEGANVSPHVLNEVELAAKASKPIIPVVFEGVQASKDLRFYIAAKQHVFWIDAQVTSTELSRSLPAPPPPPPPRRPDPVSPTALPAQKSGETVGQYLKRSRERKSENRAMVARELHLTKAAIGNMETMNAVGLNDPEQAVKQYATYLGLDAEQVFKAWLMECLRLASAPNGPVIPTSAAKLASASSRAPPSVPPGAAHPAPPIRRVAATIERMEGERTGAFLRRARLSLTLTVEEVSREARLHTWHIRAIEDMQPEPLGAPVYAKGYIRNYARYLGLDEMGILSKYLEETPLISGDVEPEPPRRRRGWMFWNQN